MSAPIDLTGQRFGNLTVVRRNGTRGKQAVWLCLCVCGAYKSVTGNHLRDGHTSGCGQHRTRLLDPESEKARVIAIRNRYRTQPGPLLYALYMKERERSKQMDWPMPAYTFDEFRDHWLNHPDFVRRYDEWKASGFKNRWLRPSVDRINSLKPYTFENTQMRNWGENRFKLNTEGRMFGRKRHLRVQQLKDGRLVREFSSAVAASIATGIEAGGIRNVLRGRYKESGGFQWRYVPSDAPTQAERSAS